MKTITKIPSNLINTTLDTSVSKVEYNKYSHTAKITVLINIDENTQLKLTDVVFETSQYQLNEKKHDIYKDLFEAESRKLKYLFDNVDFDRNDYLLNIQLCVSSRGTNYFKILSYERVNHKVSDETHDKIVNEKTEALEDSAIDEELIVDEIEKKYKDLPMSRKELENNMYLTDKYISLWNKIHDSIDTVRVQDVDRIKLQDKVLEAFEVNSENVLDFMLSHSLKNSVLVLDAAVNDPKVLESDVRFIMNEAEDILSRSNEITEKTLWHAAFIARDHFITRLNDSVRQTINLYKEIERKEALKNTHKKTAN